MKAFPQKYPLDPNKPFVSENNPIDTGMDLRDYFAAKALQGMLSDHTSQCDYDTETYEEFAKDAAVSAYIFADAMMKARG